MVFYERSSRKRNARRRILPALLTLLSLMLVVACQWPAGKAETAISLEAGPWPAADTLFHQDPRWLGADDAHSVNLESGRTLWLFGDTFIDASGSGIRSRANLIRNSIGIQSGVDPARASMQFFWRRTEVRAPGSFFPESGNTWLWPGDGMRIGRRLLIFLLRMEPSTNALGFAAVGWQAVVVENPDAPPGFWHIVDCKQPARPLPITLGSGGVLRHGGHLYAYGTDPGGTRVYLARWPENNAAIGDLRDPQWWCGESLGWRSATRPAGSPTVLFADAQTEFGIHFEPRINRFIQIQTIGFGAAGLGYRTAFRPEGPWEALTHFYLPQAASIPGILIYAAKSHPFLSGADMVITIATNHLDASRVMADQTLYFPRFVRVGIH